MATKKGKKGASLLHHMKQITPAIHAAVGAAVKTSSKGDAGPKPARVGGPGPVVNPKFITVTVGFEVDDGS